MRKIRRFVDSGFVKKHVMNLLKGLQDLDNADRDKFLEDKLDDLLGKKLLHIN